MLSSGEMVLDVLPYADAAPSKDDRAAAAALIASELEEMQRNGEVDVTQLHTSLRNPLAQQKQQEKQPTNESDSSISFDVATGVPSTLNDAVVALEYEVTRNVNLALLNERGKVVWPQVLATLEASEKAFATHRDRMSAQTKEVNIKRKREQLEAVEEIKGLNQSWNTVADKCLAIREGINATLA